jgi:NADH dehydrogenase FAD-containing subunit
MVNTRIIVVGASDTGISFIESLLSNRYLQFTSIYLIAPGGLSYYHIDDSSKNMKSSSYSYTLREYRNLLLENRVTVIDARLIEIDREEKRVILNDESVLRYDILLLAMGLQDIALK